MFAFVGSKKKPRKTLDAAVKAIMDGYEGEKAIFDTETGEIFSLSGEPTTLLTPSEYKIVTEILGLCSLLSAVPTLSFPRKLVAAMISKLSPALARDAVNTAAEMYVTLRKKHGNGGPVDGEQSG
jgi:hypothetical protein